MKDAEELTKVQQIQYFFSLDTEEYKKKKERKRKYNRRRVKKTTTLAL